MIPIGGWRIFVNFHGSAAPARLWGYRFNPNHGHPVRSFLIFWCEISWFRGFSQ